MKIISSEKKKEVNRFSVPAVRPDSVLADFFFFFLLRTADTFMETTEKYFEIESVEPWLFFKLNGSSFKFTVPFCNRK